MKVIIDTNLWISFLIGHQTQLVRRMLTDMRFDVYVCARLIEEIRDVATRNKIRKYVTQADIDDLLSIINAFCQFAIKRNRRTLWRPQTLADGVGSTLW